LGKEDLKQKESSLIEEVKRVLLPEGRMKHFFRRLHLFNYIIQDKSYKEIVSETFIGKLKQRRDLQKILCFKN